MNKVKINHQQQPINGQSSGLAPTKEKRVNKALIWTLGIIAAIIVGIIVSVFVWYNIQLSALGNDKTHLIKITIPAGSSSSQISKELQKQSVIRNSLAFDIYVRLSCKNTNLQAGTYRLSPADSVPQIIEHFVKGSVDQFSITFYPGATLVDKSDKPEKKKLDVLTVLKKAGFSDSEINTALSKEYDSPLFAGKPSGFDLEGYVYPETYNFNVGATVEDILQTTFDEMYSQIQKYNLIKSYSSYGLNLYQAITLASIVEREIKNPLESTKPSGDQRKVAQVFYSRLKIGMKLGADPTYKYITDKLGVPNDINFDSPYNTRRYEGLPPGPISAPGLSALLAIANPADTDYLYFLSGDDDVTYFTKTYSEHESNIVNHCKIKCSTQ